MAMHQALYIESRVPGVLWINGFFCGPLEGDAQAYPLGRNAEIYIEFFPFARGAQALTVAMRLEEEQITRLDPQDAAYALLWPDGIIQLELTPGQMEEPEPAETSRDGASSATLLRYLSAKLAGDMQADALLMRPQDGGAAPSLGEYIAALPLRFAPMHAGAKYDDRAGLLRRAAENVAFVDAALAVTVPVGQGRRLIERIEILRT